jgi:hypothetical protein
VHDDDVVLLRERDSAFEEVEISDRGGRVARVVEPEQLRLARDVGRDRVEVGQEAAVLAQRQS